MHQASSIKDKTTSAIITDDDFLSQHLGSLLVRQPEPSSSIMTASTSATSYASSSTSVGRRQGRDQTSTAHERRRSSNILSHPTELSRSNRRKEDAESTATTLRSPLGGSNNFMSSQTPIDGVFGALFANAPLQTPSLSMTNVKAAATDGDSNASSTSPEYFDRIRSNKNYHATPSAGSGTFTTSFGRKRPSQKRTQSGSTCSTQSMEHGDSIGNLESSPISSRKTSIDRRVSDVTQSSGRNSVDTGITTPQSFSDGYSESLKTWPEGDLTDLEEDLKPKFNCQQLSALQEYELGDQTKWTRFQEGDAIEPPEAQSQGPNAVAWAHENAIKNVAAAESRYTSMTSSRFTFSNRETVKANSRLRISNGQKGSIALIPFGEDGRTFRFITAGDDS